MFGVFPPFQIRKRVLLRQIPRKREEKLLPVGLIWQLSEQTIEKVPFRFSLVPCREKRFRYARLPQKTPQGLATPVGFEGRFVNQVYETGC